MNLRRSLLLLALVVAGALAPGARAFVFIDGFPPWPDGNVTLELQLGNTPIYSDGITPNGTAIAALGAWNPAMQRVKFTYVNNSGASKTRGNGRNNVFFDSQFFGTPFPPGVLAVATYRSGTSGPTEADVVVNSAHQWDAYRGPLQHPRMELRRVLAHEFGHVLGLDHPDEHGQWIDALMNSTISHIDAPVQDDKDGASARYGHGPGNPPLPPAFNPYEPGDMSVMEGNYASIYAYASGTQPITLQWYKDGIPIPDATSNSLVFHPAKRTDAGKYVLRATNSGGTTSSREATLTVQESQPPTIHQHPVSQTVQHSAYVHLSVAASSNSPIVYQWTKDDIPIAGATWTSYSIESVQPSDAGSYRAIATTAGGSVTSQVAIVTVVPATPPVITEHPASITVEEGLHVGFYGDAASAVPVSYQWTRDDVPIAGATRSSHSISSIRLTDAGSYRLIVTNAGGSTTSNPAVLTVTPAQPPVFRDHPMSVSVETGAPFTLSGSVWSASQVTYRWIQDGVPVPGATHPSMRFQSATPGHAGDYRLEATNLGGTSVSQVARVTVVPTRLPEFLAHPGDRTVEAGGSLWLDTYVHSAAPVTYQWTRDGVAIAGYTASSLYMSGVTESMSGEYRLLATNLAGTTASNPALVRVTPPQLPRFIVQPASIVVEVDAPLQLYPQVSSISAMSFQWLRNGVPIPEAVYQGYSVWSAKLEHAGDYVLVATNLAGSASSATARVEVIPTRPPVIIGHPASASVEAGTQLVLWCNYQSAAPASVQWSKEGVAIGGATMHYLNLNNITEAAAGTYTATVSNTGGSVTSEPAVVTVVPTVPPRFTAHPLGGVSEVGATRSMNVEVKSAVPYTIHWTRDGVPVPGASGHSLQLYDIAPDDAGIYRAVATNVAGSTLSNSATLKVVPLKPPVFSRHPESATREVGAYLQLTGLASSAIDPSYQWYHNGAPIDGATTSWLYLHEIREDQAGAYHLTATNAAGTATSREAILEVIPLRPPTITQQPTDLTMDEGGAGHLTAGVSGAGDLTVHWYKDGQAIPGAEYPSLWFSSTTPSDSGEYTLVATNSAGSVSTNTVVVTVLPPGPPRFTVQPTSRQVIIGESVRFYAWAERSEPITYQWYKDGTPIPDATAGQLHFDAPELADDGTYHAVATNAHGSTESRSATLTVSPPPLPFASRLTNMTVPEDGIIHLYVAQPADVVQATVQWYRDGEEIAGANSFTLYISPARPADSGEYFARTGNATGTVTSTTALVEVVPHPQANPRWISSARVGDTLLLPSATLNRIERVDLATDTELPVVHLSLTPAALAATADHLFVAFGPDIVRMHHDGTGATPFATVGANVMRMVVVGDHLLVSLKDHHGYGGERIASVSSTDGSVREVSSQIGTITGALAVEPDGSRVYVTAHDITATNPSGLGIASLDIGADGAFAALHVSQQATLFPIGNRLWRFPTRPWVIDDTGTVFDGDALVVVGSIGRPFASLDFTDDGGLVVLRGREVSVYDDTLIRVRRFAVNADAIHVAVQGDTVVVLSPGTSGGGAISIERHPLTLPNPPLPLDPVAPGSIDFVPDAVAVDRVGNLLLLSRFHSTLFVWDVREQRFVRSIRVEGHPNQLACASDTNTVILGYADRTLVAIDLDGDGTPRSIGAAPWDIATIFATGVNLGIAGVPDYRETRLALVGAHGEIVTLARAAAAISEVHWSASDSRLYFDNVFDIQSTVDFLPLVEESRFGSQEAATAYVYSDGPSARLLRVSPDSRLIVREYGQIVDTATGPAVPRSFPVFKDAAWLGDRTYLHRDTSVGSEVSRYDATLALDAATPLSGRAFRIFPAGPDRLVALTTKRGRTLFTLLDADLNILRHYDEDHTDRSNVANLSIRADVGTGDGIVVAGFVVTGGQPKRMLVRAAGPALVPFGVGTALPDPVLELTTLAGASIVDNDDWGSDDAEALRAAFTQAGAFPFAEGSADSAVLATLDPGQYTAKVSGKDGGTGITLVEAYDLDDPSPTPRLVNISSRAYVGIGHRVLIPGLVITGPDPKRILVRAVGPTLAEFGVAGVLADPRIAVIDAEQRVIHVNDDWTDDNTEVIAASAAAAGAFPLPAPSADAAVAITLPPGRYTIGVSGANDTSGIALVEVYEVP